MLYSTYLFNFARIKGWFYKFNSPLKKLWFTNLSFLSQQKL